MSADFDVFVFVCKMTKEPIPCFLRFHSLDANLLRLSIQEYHDLFMSANGYGLRAIQNETVIPGFFEIYDQHERFMRFINHAR